MTGQLYESHLSFLKFPQLIQNNSCISSLSEPISSIFLTFSQFILEGVRAKKIKKKCFRVEGYAWDKHQ